MKNTDKNLKNLKSILELWLKSKDLFEDVHFQLIEDWKERGESYLNDSDLVMTFEGTLQSILNGYLLDEEYDEFNNLCERFGYYMELGFSWCGGFYKIPDYNSDANRNLTYSEKLRDIRWRRLRTEVVERENSRCQECGAFNMLEIHHTYYVYGFEPWQYPLDSLKCLCRDCHERRGTVEKVFRAKLSKMSLDQIQGLESLIDNGFYW